MEKDNINTLLADESTPKSDLADRIPCAQYQHCSLDIATHSFSKLESHLRTLKHIETPPLNKQQWITRAIQHKLEREQNAEIASKPRSRHLSFKIDKNLNEQIEKNVKLIQKFHTSYSKKKWILEAVQEQLEKEEPATKKFVNDYLNS